MSRNQKTPHIPLPKGWTTHVRSAVLHILSLAQYAAVYTRSWAADSTNTRVRLKAELDRATRSCFCFGKKVASRMLASLGSIHIVVPTIRLPSEWPSWR